MPTLEFRDPRGRVQRLDVPAGDADLVASLKARREARGWTLLAEGLTAEEKVDVLARRVKALLPALDTGGLVTEAAPERA